jgi:hypothetical protein
MTEMLLGKARADRRSAGQLRITGKDNLQAGVQGNCLASIAI